MKIIATVVIGLMIPLALVQGQQDSLVIDSVYVDSGQIMVALPVFGVTFDSIDFFSVALRCNAPLGGVYMIPQIFYYPPITSWDELFDSVYVDENYIRMIGFADVDGIPNPPIFTDGYRDTVWILSFNIAPDAPPQVVTIDTVGYLGFGNNPAFRRGYIIIGPLTGLDDGVNQTPQSFELNQNYPNPFNAQTTISYSLAKAGPVTLSIYNIMGQKVATLADSKQEPGEHKVVWDAGDMPSGVYFGRLENGLKSQISNMILLK